MTEKEVNQNTNDTPDKENGNVRKPKSFILGLLGIMFGPSYLKDDDLRKPYAIIFSIFGIIIGASLLYMVAILLYIHHERLEIDKIVSIILCVISIPVGAVFGRLIIESFASIFFPTLTNIGKNGIKSNKIAFIILPFMLIITFLLVSVCLRMSGLPNPIDMVKPQKEKEIEITSEVNWMEREQNVWIEKGIIYAKGSAKMASMSMARTTAETRARTNLMRALIENEISGFSSGAADTSVYTSSIYNGITVELADYKEVDLDFDDDGTAYVLISCTGAKF